MSTPLDRLREAALALRLQRFARGTRRTGGGDRGIPEFRPDTQQFYRLLIEEARCLATELQEPRLLIDIGCADWGYLPALASGFPLATRIFGFEADPGRIYWTGLSRGGLADARARRFSSAPSSVHEVIFIPGDFTATPLPWSPAIGELAPPALFTAFFPFVSEAPARAWGLPGRFADFRALLERIRALASAIGEARPAALLSVHQGAWEDEIAERLLREAQWQTGATRIERARFEAHWPGKYDVFVRFSRGPLLQK